MKITVTKDGESLAAIATVFRNPITRHLTIELQLPADTIVIPFADIRGALHTSTTKYEVADIVLSRSTLTELADWASAQLPCTLRDVIIGDRITTPDGYSQKVHFAYHPSDAAIYIRSDRYTKGCWLNVEMPITIAPIAVAMDDRQPQYARKVARVGRSLD